MSDIDTLAKTIAERLIVDGPYRYLESVHQDNVLAEWNYRETVAEIRDVLSLANWTPPEKPPVQATPTARLREAANRARAELVQPFGGIDTNSAAALSVAYAALELLLITIDAWDEKLAKDADDE